MNNRKAGKLKEKSVLVGRDKNISLSLGNGVTVRAPSFSIALDPERASSCDYTFVSHAHIDHVHSANGKSKILASKETAKLARARGYDLGLALEDAPGIELIDAGHILGSRSVLIEDRVFYTGDISRRSRGFLHGCKGVKCDTLIMETTYGKPRYLFPETDLVVQQVNSLIAKCFDECRPVILSGYALGKAQLISYLFDYWDPVYLHESVYEMNSAHIDLGVKLRHFEKFVNNPETEKTLRKGPWIMIAPMSGGRSSFVRTIVEKYGAAVATFTGWAVDSRFRYSTKSEHAFPVSDHCDFQELVDLVKYCDPSKIYTVHGFAEEFAVYIRALGFDAEPLVDTHGQVAISDYT